MKAKKKILMLCDSDLSREPRFIRQIIALKNEYEIVTVGAAQSEFKELEYFQIPGETQSHPWHWKYPSLVRKALTVYFKSYQYFKFLYKSSYFENEYWAPRRKVVVEAFKNRKFDIIIAHHWDALPMAYQIGKRCGAKLVFNAHDYYPRQFEDNDGWNERIRPGVNFVMDKYLPKFDLVFSAWTKIHEDFQETYKLPSVIINNATEFNDLQPQLKNSSNAKEIRLVHHGIANPNRKIEWMIEMMQYLDNRFTLDFILLTNHTNSKYFEELKDLSKTNDRIRFLNPVGTRDIARTINYYDIGIFLLPPNGFNPTYLLPNKLFEYIQGRLACLISPSFEMKKIVQQFDIGWIAKEFTPHALAAEIQNLSWDELNEKKNNTHKIALELSAEHNYDIIKRAIADLIDDPVADKNLLTHKYANLYF